MLEGRNISKKYKDRNSGKQFTVLDNVSLTVDQGEAVGLMGGSGSGKSTLAKILLRLIAADSGKIFFAGDDITNLSGRRLKKFRQAVQFIPQRPESFLDPMLTLGQSLYEPFAIFSRSADKERILKLLDLVKLNKEILNRYPHQVSGGEIQRICIARAMLLEPRLLILDEPTSMLDVSVQAQILQLLKQIRQEREIAYLYISHDPQLAEWLCDRILVIKNGRLV